MKRFPLCLVAFLVAVSPSFGAQQAVNVGPSANSGLGDAPRSAFMKLNANDAELYAAIATLQSALGNGSSFLLKSSNLAGLPSLSAAHANLGLGSIATQGANAVSITGGTIGGTTDVSGGRVAGTALGSIINSNPASGSWPLLLSGDVPSGVPSDAGKISAANPVAFGTGYYVGDIVSLVGGTSASPAKLQVASAALVGAAIQSGGTGWSVGDSFYFDANVAAGEVYVYASAKVTSVSGGAVTGFTIYDTGTYTLSGQGKSTFSGVAYAGTGTGLVFNAPVWGAATLSLVDPGSYTVQPTSPVATAPVTGTGSGLTVDPTWRSGSLRDLLGLVPIRTKTTYGRVPAKGVQFDIDGVPWMVAYHNDPSALVPGQNYAAGSDGTLAFNGFSNITFTTNYAVRLPTDNPSNQLRGPLVDFNLDVPNPAVGSYVMSMGWAARTTGSSLVNTYYGAIATQILDPSPSNPSGSLQFLTADPDNNSANRKTRFAIGKGVMTANADGSLSLTDMGVGSANAVKFYTSNQQFAQYGTYGGVPGVEIGSYETNSYLKLCVSGGCQWALNPNGPLVPIFDGTMDIGQPGNRIRNLYIGTSVIETTARTPASSTDACTTGQHAWDANFEYRCVATNTWKRAALSTW